MRTVSLAFKLPIKQFMNFYRFHYDQIQHPMLYWLEDHSLLIKLFLEHQQAARLIAVVVFPTPPF